MPRWQRDTGEGRMTSDELATVSRKLLRQQFAEQPEPKRRETAERALELARRWPGSYLARELTTIYGVKP